MPRAPSPARAVPVLYRTARDIPVPMPSPGLPLPCHLGFQPGPRCSIQRFAARSRSLIVIRGFRGPCSSSRARASRVWLAPGRKDRARASAVADTRKMVPEYARIRPHRRGKTQALVRGFRHAQEIERLNQIWVLRRESGRSMRSVLARLAGARSCLPTPGSAPRGSVGRFRAHPPVRAVPVPNSRIVSNR